MPFALALTYYFFAFWFCPSFSATGLFSGLVVHHSLGQKKSSSFACDVLGQEGLGRGAAVAVPLCSVG